MEARLETEIGRLVADLVAGRYALIVGDGRGGRLSQPALEEAVSNYGRTLVPLPAEAWTLVDEYPTDDGSIAVDVPLWTSEEGRSDLTLSLTATRDGDRYRIEIEDLHVL